MGLDAVDVGNTWHTYVCFIRLCVCIEQWMMLVMMVCMKLISARSYRNALNQYKGHKVKYACNEVSL